MSGEMRAALEAVAEAMLSGGDGKAGDFGWSITKLNRARPMIRAALAASTEPTNAQWQAAVAAAPKPDGPLVPIGSSPGPWAVDSEWVLTDTGGETAWQVDSPDGSVCTMDGGEHCQADAELIVRAVNAWLAAADGGMVSVPREPTAAMLDAAGEAWFYLGEPRGREVALEPAEAARVWTAMLDAAQSETGA